MSSESNSRVLYENLDTSFVNLWGLLRYLSRKNFVGRVHVEMNDYAADVFLTGSDTPLVHEVDRAAGTDRLEEAALHRLVLRARESSGSISVFEGPEEAVVMKSPTTETGAQASALATDSASPAAPASEDACAPVDWNGVVKISSELIAAVERALTDTGGSFPALFQAARLDLADDYTFLDPTSGSIEYSNSTITAREELPISSYVAGLSDALRRVVDKAATGNRARRIRELVALELSVVTRKHREILKRSGFLLQLDRIAGTKVI